MSVASLASATLCGAFAAVAVEVEPPWQPGGPEGGRVHDVVFARSDHDRAYALEDRVLLAVAPELYAHAYPEGVEEASYEKLLAHEVAHRLHVRILDDNEDAMGPIWFYEGFALFAADQLLHSDVELSEEEIWSVVGAPERGSYARYAFVFRHFAARAPLPVLVKKAGEPGFVEWLHSLEGPGQT